MFGQIDTRGHEPQAECDLDECRRPPCRFSTLRWNGLRRCGLAALLVFLAGLGQCRTVATPVGRAPAPKRNALRASASVSSSRSGHLAALTRTGFSGTPVLLAWDPKLGVAVYKARKQKGWKIVAVASRSGGLSVVELVRDASVFEDRASPNETFKERPAWSASLEPFLGWRGLVVVRITSFLKGKGSDPEQRRKRSSTGFFVLRMGASPEVACTFEGDASRDGPRHPNRTTDERPDCENGSFEITVKVKRAGRRGFEFQVVRSKASTAYRDAEAGTCGVSSITRTVRPEVMRYLIPQSGECSYRMVRRAQRRVEKLSSDDDDDHDP